MSFLAEILSSKTRAEIFRLLFGLKEAPLHLRELQRLSHLAVGTIQQELEKLIRLALLIRRKDGNRVYFEPNREHPVYGEIRRMVLKTSGLADLLKQALEGSDIRCAFIFGSVARGTEDAESDIDLMVIGEIGLRRLVSLLSGVSERLGRPINPHVLTVSEFSERCKKKEHFVKKILEDSKIFLIGTEHELETMARAHLKITFVTRPSEKVNGENKTRKIPEPYLQ